MHAWSDMDEAIREGVRDWIGKFVEPVRDEIESGELAPYDLARQFFADFGATDMARDAVRKLLASERRRAEARAAGEPRPAKKDRSGEPNPMLDMLSMGAVVGSELAGVSLGTMVSLGVSIGLGAATILQKGTLEQKERYVEKIATLEHIAAWSITEPDSGSDAFGGMKTTVRRDGDEFVLTGSKTFATNGPDADVAVRDVVTDDFGRHSFTLAYAGRSAPVRLRQLGGHQVMNAAAAAGLALGGGLEIDLVAETLSSATAQSRWRMELHERGDGVAVINDAYNANPESTMAALETLQVIARRSGRRTIAVLGEMLELADPQGDHERVGRFAAQAGIDVLVTVGEQAAAYADGAAGVTGWRGRAIRTEGRDDATAWVRNNVASGDVVLVKASRGAALEHVADGLIDEGDPDR